VTVYDEVFEAWKREGHSSNLQPLRPGFFKDVASYVRRLKEAQRNLDPKSLKAQVLEDELGRLQQLIHQLVDRRMEKARGIAGGKEPASVDLPEKWILEELAGMTRHVSRFKEDLAQGIEPSAFPEKKRETLMVRIIKDLPAIVGVDLQTHGPFKAEDVASLPFENAESLIRQGAAVEVRVRPRENE
jgi:DNA replication factor GINS